ncbi:Retrovirus-related Pol polyprotein from transposon TNT 1-94 [Trichinella sp. T6]|nr:Retrovirus-related Pol polyprotein from transposon TNT 1-94 [Trichinella sp. T6]
MWLADSGASQHMTRNKEYLSDFVTFPKPVNVKVGNGDAIPAYGHGTVNFKVFIKGKWILNRMEDVWYVPKLGLNLFSIGKATEKGFNFTANAAGCTFRKNGCVKLSGVRNLNGVYELHMRVCIPEKPAYVHVSTANASLQLWHERLCHQNKRHVQQVLNNHGIKVHAQEQFRTGCVLGKHHRESFQSRKYRPRAPGKLIHVDLCGLMHVTSLGGSNKPQQVMGPARFLCAEDLNAPMAPPAGSYAENLKKHEEALKAFEKEDTLAQLILVSSMNDANVELTATSKSSAEIWQKLTAVYEQSSGQRVDRLMEEFFKCAKAETEDMARYVARLQKLFSDLNDELERLTGTQLPDLLLMSRIMSTLPQDYFEFKTVWESVPVGERSVNLLIERLRLIEMRLPEKTTDSSVALTVKTDTKENVKKDRRNEECGAVTAVVGDSLWWRFVCYQMWLADSGASQHIARNKEYLSDFVTFPKPVNVKVGNGDAIPAYGQGTVNFKVFIKGKWILNRMEDVWYVPKLELNLFSIGKATEKSVWCTNLNGVHELHMRVYIPEKPAYVHVSTANASLQLWHERLYHQNKRNVQQVLNNHGIKVYAQGQFCTGCVLGKHHRESFQSRKYRPRAPGKLIHVDLCGPMHVTSLGGSKYFLVFKDDFSRYRRVFFLKRKDDVAQCLQTFLNESRTAGNTVECILNDGGLEFNNAHVKNSLQRRGVAMHTAMLYTPEQNGVTERENRILVETACHVLNRTGPTTVKGKSPMELWFKRDLVSIDHFHVFGTECFVRVPKQRRRKWEKKSVAGRFMGYCDEKDGYRIWLPDINHIDNRMVNNAHVKDILQRRGVAMRTAMPYTPEQNGVAERENRILF